MKAFHESDGLFCCAAGKNSFLRACDKKAQIFAEQKRLSFATPPSPIIAQRRPKFVRNKKGFHSQRRNLRVHRASSCL
jgi:hypothetical protein